jgi:hypothetical protein
VEDDQRALTNTTGRGGEPFTLAFGHWPVSGIGIADLLTQRSIDRESHYDW